MIGSSESSHWDLRTIVFYNYASINPVRSVKTAGDSYAVSACSCTQWVLLTGFRPPPWVYNITSSRELMSILALGYSMKSLLVISSLSLHVDLHRKAKRIFVWLAAEHTVWTLQTRTPLLVSSLVSLYCSRRSEKKSYTITDFWLQ